jgi:predicted glycoside hydrolase/deacetylase ChbG (UPF0249 family)
MKTKKLIVNADDFGQSDEVNQGIIRSYEKGILTSASLMVRYPFAEKAAEYAHKNNLDIGLHVDLGEWILLQDGWKALYEVVPVDNTEAVMEELNNQLEAFFRITGKKPSHLDSHQHVHMRKTIQPVFIELARQLNVTLRRCSSKVVYCGNFYGQHQDGSPNQDAISPVALMQIINNLQNGITELACHPGINIEINTMYKKERDLEVDSLCNDEVKGNITGKGVELISFAGITF